jgi:hypothetical protein
MMSRVDLERTAVRVTREVRYLKALVLINLVYGVVAFGISISAIVTALTPVFSMNLSALPSILAPQTLLTIAFAAVILALSARWFFHSIEMLDAVDDLGKVRDQRVTSNDEGRAEHVVGMIVELLSYYRQHQDSIRAFRILGKASGLMFIGLGALWLLQAILVSPANVAQALLGLAATLPPGVAGIYISHSFGKYQDTWDPRLIAASGAEEELRKLLDRS